MVKRKFTWAAWDFDEDGDAYIIAKDECPNIADVPEYICKEDCLTLDDRKEAIMKDIKEGWCKYQVRTDWINGDGEPAGGYCVEDYEPFTKDIYGKRKPGWFPVWIVRKGEWY